jgi:hypothetical protein
METRTARRRKRRNRRIRHCLVSRLELGPSSGSARRRAAARLHFSTLRPTHRPSRQTTSRPRCTRRANPRRPLAVRIRPTRRKNIPRIPCDFGASSPQLQLHPHQTSPQFGEVAGREMFESVGPNALSVRFEINIVNVGAIAKVHCLTLVF